MLFLFNNAVTREYDEADALLILEFLKFEPAEIVKVDEYTDQEMDEVLNTIKESEPICMGCNNEYDCGANGYCSTCWLDVFGDGSQEIE